MKLRPPTLAPLLRTNLQGDLLAALFLHPGREYTLTELARHLRAGLSTVHTEVDRLAEGELVEERRLGRARLLRANQAHPLAPSLTELLTLTYGPPAVLPGIIGKLSGVEEAFLYGSWAARRLGEAGPFPEDVDVLVVGDVPRRAVGRAQAEATAALHRDVNLAVLAPHEWAEPTSGFARTVHAGALLKLELEK